MSKHMQRRTAGVRRALTVALALVLAFSSQPSGALEAMADELGEALGTEVTEVAEPPADDAFDGQDIAVAGEDAGDEQAEGEAVDEAADDEQADDLTDDVAEPEDGQAGEGEPEEAQEGEAEDETAGDDQADDQAGVVAEPEDGQTDEGEPEDAQEGVAEDEQDAVIDPTTEGEPTEGNEDEQKPADQQKSESEEAEPEDEKKAEAEADDVKKAEAEEKTEESKKPEPQVLEAKLDGIRAKLTVDGLVKLPEGAQLVITKVEKPVDEVADEEAEAKDETEAETETAAEDEVVVYDATDDESEGQADEQPVAEPEAAADSEAAEAAADSEATEAAAGIEADVEAQDAPTTGTQVVLSIMNKALATARKKSAPDDTTTYEVVTAYVFEVVDAEGNAVLFEKDQAKLELTLPADDELLQADGLYAVERVLPEEMDDEEPEDEEGLELEAAADEENEPQANTMVVPEMVPSIKEQAEKEYDTADGAIEAARYGAKATELAEDAVTVDKKANEATLALDGAASLAATSEVVAKPAKKAAKAPGGPLKAPVSYPSGKVRTDTIDTKEMGIIINLFDYDAEDTGHNDINHPSTTGINTGTHSNDDLRFFDHGTQAPSGTPPTINHYAGVKNDYKDQFAMQGILQAELAKGNPDDPTTWFPLLNTSGTADKNNLSYLFSKDAATGKTVYADVNKLFYPSNGNMEYDSNNFYAYYNNGGANDGNFTVYQDTYYRASGSGNSLAIGFFPFDQYNSASSHPNVSINPANGNYPNPHVNHSFGMTMTAPITMPYNGYIYNRETGTYTPMDFKFSGDDDMWVFVDGHLVLDVGGIHQPVAGEMNFASGDVRISSGYPNYSNDTTTDNHMWTMTASNAVDTSAHTFGDVTQMWGTDGSLGVPKSDKTWKAGTDHWVQCFYLERGGCDSNLMLSSNIHLLTKLKADVKKEWPEGYDPKGKEITVELVQKATIREMLINEDGSLFTQEHGGYDAVAASVYSSKTLSSAEVDGNAPWEYHWKNLPREGYTEFKSASGKKQEFYCDYDYYVREVPTAGFDASYSTVDKNGNPKAVAANEYGTLGSGDDTVFLGVSNSVRPVVVTNTTTTIDVEKQWLDEAGKDETRDIKHNDDVVWAQLYKQVKSEGGEWGPKNGIAVGKPFDLKHDNAWTQRLELQERGDNVRYFVREGVMANGTFVATNDLPAAGRTYTLDSTSYTRTVNVPPETPSAQPKVVNLGTNTATMPYYWKSVDNGTDNEAGEHVANWVQTRTYDRATETMQEAGNENASVQTGYEKAAFTSDTINVQLTISPDAAEMPEHPTDALDYVATITAADGINVSVDSVPDGFALSQPEGVLTLTLPAAQARAMAGQTVSVPVTVTRPGNADLTAITKDAPGSVTVTQKVYDLNEDGGTSAADPATYTDYVSVTPHGTAHAVIKNKPKQTDIMLLKLDAGAPATDDYEAGKTPLEGVTFILVKDDGVLEGEEGAKHPVYNKAADNQRMPKEDSVHTTGADGKVKLAGGFVQDAGGNDVPTGLDSGTYWLIETGAPEGYLVRDENFPIGITVGEDGVPTLVLDPAYDSATSKTLPTLTGPDDDGAYQLVVPNARLYTLPSAGGPGSYLFLLGGAFAAALAASSARDERRRLLSR